MAAAYAVLVAHLLFIPYAYAPLSLDEALSLFARIPWLELGSDQNVALVSRALMFLPLGLLIAASLAPRPSGPAGFLAAALAIAAGTAWASGVNFVQLWFPGRTFSLNNLVAETAGVAVGALGWSLFGAAGLRWWTRLSTGGFVSLRAALGAYVVSYLAASLSPFDFVTSAAELAQKIASGAYALWAVPGGCGPASCTLKYAVSLLAALPCGWWFADRTRAAPRSRGGAAMVALAFSLTIEFLHFFMVSGVSQGASALVRVAGLLVGFEAYSWRGRLAGVSLDRFARPAVLALLPAYLAALAYVSGWFRSGLLGVSAGLARLNDFVWTSPEYRGDVIVWMPFYYQYYEGYQSTMQSTMIHAVLYAPLGAACWLWARDRDRVPVAAAALIAAALAFAVETGKLFLVGRHPDYTDVLFAAVAASVALVVLRFVSRVQHRVVDGAGAARPDQARRPDSSRTATDASAVGPGAQGLARAVGVLAIAAAALLVIDFPIARWALALGLAGYAALLLRMPTAYLIAIPVLLPVLDLAPLSGRFYWDEFDALLATTIGTRLLMGIPAARQPVRLPGIALGVLLTSVVVSAVIAVWPAPPLDANAFSSYLSGYNALRVAKGYGWATVLVWLVARDAAAGRTSVPSMLMAGLAAGLASAAAGVFWERLSFLGAAGLDESFRAAGMVSATHVGGAYLEVMLVVLTPFALAMAVAAQRPAQRLLALVAVASGALAVLMTISRAAFAAWLAAMAAFALVWWWRSRARRANRAQRRPARGTGLAVLGLILGTALAAQSTYLRERLGMSGADLSFRAAHWQDAIDLVPRDAAHILFGMGLGSFPREFYLAHAGAQQLPAYRLEPGDGADPPHLVLTGGRGMYLDQRVAVGPGAQLTVSGLVRSAQENSPLSLSLCAKSMLNSVGCSGATVTAGRKWARFERPLAAPGVEDRAGLIAQLMPISLSLHNGTFGSRVEVTQLSLRDGRNEFLHNGSFRDGLDRWFVTSDVHLAWRVLSTPLQIAFEQGALGVLAWLLLGAMALASILRPEASNSPSTPLAGAVVGLLAVGAFDSVLDSPRIVLLVAMLWATTVAQPGIRNGVAALRGGSS